MPDSDSDNPDHVNTEGRCLCGGAHYKVEGTLHGLIHCHCRRCRKHHGSTFASFAVFEDAALTWVRGYDLLDTYASSDRINRHFCRLCGSVMPGQQTGSLKTSLPAGNLLDMQRPATVYHVYVASKAPWAEVPSQAHQFDSIPPHWQDQNLSELVRPELDRSALDPLSKGRIRGSCLCGDVSFAAINPLFMMNCHCTRCRRSRSSAHATNLFVPGDHFSWVSGEAGVVNYKLPDAVRFGAAFCRRCGSLVPRVQSPRMDRINIPAGCLDADPGVRPRGHIFAGSKADWFDIEDDLPQWEETFTDS